MTFDQLRQAWKIDCGSSSAKLVFMALAFHTDDKGACWPSIQTLMRECNLCERAVQNQIKWLATAGLLRVEHGGGKHVVNRYFLTVPNPAPDTVYPIPRTGYGVSGSRYPAFGSSNPAPDAPQLLGTAKNSHSKEIEPMNAAPTPESSERLERLRIALHQAFNRRPNQRWSYMEMSILVEINRREEIEEELAELLAYKKKAGRFFPQSLSALLDGWTETLDRSRQPEYENANHKQTGQQRISASAGTANEGTAAGYANARAIRRPVAQVTPAIPDLKRPGPSGNGVAGH